MSKPQACPRCQLHYQCICDSIPTCHSPAHIALVMHENELTRDTNTGRWLLEAVEPSSRHIWQRGKPCQELLDLINDSDYTPYLLFPDEKSIEVEVAQNATLEAKKKALFIILDGTWQEARKMLRKSDWLKTLPTVHITPMQASSYQLRRNQESGNLCTLEVGSELLKVLSKPNEAQALTEFFAQYVPIFKADKSGHSYSAEH